MRGLRIVQIRQGDRQVRLVASMANRPARACAVAMLVIATLTISSPLSAFGQETGDGTPIPGETWAVSDEVVPPQDEPTPPEPEDDVVPEAPPVSEETGADTPSTETASPPDEDSAAENPAELPDSTPETPPPPHLTYAPAPAISCQPAAPYADGVIAAGASFDYDCTVAVDISAQRLRPGDLALDWHVSVTSDGDWSIQISTAPLDESAWSEPTLDRAEISTRSAGPETLATAEGELAGTVSLPFGVRLVRPACAAVLPLIQVEAAVAVSATADGDVITEQTADQPEPLTLAPQPAAIPEGAPAVTIEQFYVAPVSFSLVAQATTGTITVRIDNSVIQCHAWTLLLSITASTGGVSVGESSALSVEAITDTTGGGYTAITAAQNASLTSPAGVGVVLFGAAPGSFTQTITFTLTIPGQLRAGTVNVQATAIVEPDAA